MERIKFICMECDNECRLSFRQDSSDMPKDCFVDSCDDTQAIWESDN